MTQELKRLKEVGNIPASLEKNKKLEAVCIRKKAALDRTIEIPKKAAGA